VPALKEILGVVVEGDRAVPQRGGTSLTETDDVQEGCVTAMEANAHDYV